MNLSMVYQTEKIRSHYTPINYKELYTKLPVTVTKYDPVGPKLVIENSANEAVKGNVVVFVVTLADTANEELIGNPAGKKLSDIIN